MVNLPLLRRIYNNRHYRKPGGWRAPGIAGLIKADTVTSLIAADLVYENTKGNQPFVDLTDAGKAAIFPNRK